jgi:hypothetical protein
LRGDVKAKIEREIIAARDLALQTKYHATKIFNRNREQMQTMSTV